ncbi:hypothetical protein K438DRAFT_1972994 [Mycena galopus ATCC 62051]|nr:hypothetical protein K438DRAFT_1972994 [Mycena galopus ATCC 62051]
MGARVASRRFVVTRTHGDRALLPTSETCGGGLLLPAFSFCSRSPAVSSASAARRRVRVRIRVAVARVRECDLAGAEGVARRETGARWHEDEDEDHEKKLRGQYQYP